MARSIPLPDPPLADDVVVLRPLRDEDVPALYEACQDPDIQRFTFVPAPYTEAHARAFVAGSAAERETGEGAALAIVDAGDEHHVLGTVGVVRPDWDNAVAELGYWVAPWARGRGLAARAVGLLGPWAFRTLGMARLTLHIDAANAPSRRVAERAGFAYEGTLRSAILAKGRRWDLALYARLARDEPS
jgi:RimJ/RimL family protein N-acetyltransferase